MFTVHVEGLPIPQGSKVVMRGHLVDVRSKELKAWRAKVAAAARAAGCTPIEGPVHVSLAFTLPRPKTVKRATPFVKPDLDKLMRAAFDALTGVAYMDDGQVIGVSAWKRYETVKCPVGLYLEVRGNGQESAGTSLGTL